MTKIIKWAREQFEYMKGKNKIPLNVSDFKAVRKIAFTKYGENLKTAEAVAIAFRKEQNK